MIPLRWDCNTCDEIAANALAAALDTLGAIYEQAGRSEDAAAADERAREVRSDIGFGGRGVSA